MNNQPYAIQVAPTNEFCWTFQTKADLGKWLAAYDGRTHFTHYHYLFDKYEVWGNGRALEGEWGATPEDAYANLVDAALSSPRGFADWVGDDSAASIILHDEPGFDEWVRRATLLLEAQA
jgi:hypothetical protein